MYYVVSAAIISETPTNRKENMLGRSAATAARVAARSQPKGQKRTFIDYLTNYPDRVSFIASVPPERRPRSFSVSVALSYRFLRRTNVHDQRMTSWRLVFCSCWSVVAYSTCTTNGLPGIDMGACRPKLVGESAACDLAAHDVIV